MSNPRPGIAIKCKASRIILKSPKEVYNPAGFEWAVMDPSALEKVEAKRKELEESVARLRKSLRHWQTLELDYEGLREEYTMLRGGVTEQKCLEVARAFKPEALDEKDLHSLMKDAAKHPSNRAQQLAHILAKRVEYVTRNVETIRKQLEGEQKKLNAILLAQDPDTQDDAGLPLGEIIEEIDDSGRVISGKVEHAGGKAAGLAEVLEKVGVKGLKDNDGKVTASESTAETVMSQSGTTASSNSAAESPLEFPQTSREALPPTDLPPKVLAPGSHEKPDVNMDSDSDTSSVASLPNNPGDTEEEAQLRQEMINYDANTMNAVVAELNLAEDASDISYDEDSDDAILIPDSDNDLDEEDEDEEDDESEGETGATKRLHLSSEYKKQMEELQEKLGLKDMKNLGPEPALPDDVQRQINGINIDRPSAAEAARKAALERADQTEKLSQKDQVTGEHMGSSNINPQKIAKKKVAFSDSLDVAEVERGAPTSDLPSRSKPTTDEVNPVNDTVLERSSSPTITPAPPSAPHAPASRKAKVSRFKAQRATDPVPPSSLTPPTDRLVATTVLERPTPSSSAAPDPDSIDDELHRKQIAIEYHKIKSRKMHQQGGYVKHAFPGQQEEDDDDGDDDWYTKDPETGAVRKLSKFKAARLR